MFICACAHVCMCMWKPQLSTGCYSSGAVYLAHFEIVLQWPGPGQIGKASRPVSIIASMRYSAQMFLQLWVLGIEPWSSRSHYKLFLD